MKRPKKEDYYPLYSRLDDYLEDLEKYVEILESESTISVDDDFNCLNQNIKGDEFKCKEHCNNCNK